MPKTADAHLHADNPPNFAIYDIPIAKFGSITTSARLLVFKARKALELVSLLVAPTTIASGTLKVDILVGSTVAGATSVLSTLALVTVADTPVAPVFSSTRVAEGYFVVVKTASDSSTVTDVLGMLQARPLLGKEL